MKQDYVQRQNSSGENHYVGVQTVEPLMIESQITEHSERDFTWSTSYINGREIASGTAVSLEQAKFLAAKAYESEATIKCAPSLPGRAPRTTL
jgi:hypothetical protein